MNKSASIASGTLLLYANCILFPPAQWQDAAIICAAAIVFAFILWLGYNIKFKLFMLPIFVLLIPFATFELSVLATAATNFVAENPLVVLITFGVSAAFLFYAGESAFQRLTQLLFWIIPLVLIASFLSPIQNKLVLIPERLNLSNVLLRCAFILPAVFSLAVITKRTGGTRNIFLLGIIAGAVAFAIQSVALSLNGAPNIVDRHPLLSLAMHSPLPLEILFIAVVAFSGVIRVSSILIAASMPLPKVKCKNIYIISLFSISTVFLYLLYRS